MGNLRARGTQFLDVPKAYYTDLRERLKHSKVKIEEDLDAVCKNIELSYWIDYYSLKFY